MLFRSVLCAVVIAVLASGCGKVYDLNGSDWVPDVPPSDSAFNREIQILNLGASMPPGHQPLDDDDPIFFSLERFSSIGLAYKTTERWDITFSGQYRSDISGNNGKRSGFGYGASGIGGIVVLDAGFDDVTEVPDESRFQYPGLTGLDDQGFFGNPLGHVVYTFFGNFLRPDKVKDLESSDPAKLAEAAKYQHMVYCLSQETCNTFKDIRALRPRTIIIKTAKGNYAKMETQSMYENTMSPFEMRWESFIKVPVFSFRYVLLKAEDHRFGFMLKRPKLIVKL